MEKKILRLLIVDDSPDDAELAAASLRKAGYMLKHQRVQDLASMQAALDKGTWDAVLSEYTLPHFGAQLALDLVKRAHLDIPFFVVTRSIRDPDLIKIMHNGARDVVLKNQFARLAPAVERELLVTEERRKHQKMSLALNEVENKNRAIIEGSREAICYCLDGMHIDANKTYLDMFGYSDMSELEGVPVLNLVDKSDHARFKEYLRKISSATPPGPQEFLAFKKTGDHFHAELTISPVVLNGENCIQCVVIDVSKRKAVENRLQYLNEHDPLTGLFNRHYFTQELTRVLDKVKKGGGRCALLYLDLIELKEINDTLGHAAGDRLLLKIARLFREKLGESALLARFSGDEFTALLHDMSEEDIKKSVTALLDELKRTTFQDSGKTFKCDGTVGVVALDKSCTNAQTVLNKAYQISQGHRPAKAPPRAAPMVAVDSVPVEVISAAPPPAEAPTADVPALTPKEVVRPVPAATSSSGSARDWEARLKTALEKGGFELAYQPIVNLHGDALEYFEVLLRLVGRNGELIHAGEFMPAAEQLDMLSAIDRWVTRQSVQSLAALHREGRQASFFVNLSPSSLKDPELLSLVQKQISASRLKPEYLVLEADEPAVMGNRAETNMFLQAVRRIGCRFAIDNFGNNLGAVNHLRDMPVDFLKISGSLIRNLSTDVLTRTSLKAIIDLARAMNKQTIAKFVERADDLGLLWNLGLDYVQGNYLQQADAHTNYAFSEEASLSSSDSNAPNWANSRR